LLHASKDANCVSETKNMSVSHDTVFPNPTLGKLNKNSMTIYQHIFDYNEICNCLIGLLVLLNGIPDVG